MSAVITSMRTFEMQSCEDDADSYVRDVRLSTEGHVRSRDSFTGISNRTHVFPATVLVALALSSRALGWKPCKTWTILSMTVSFIV